MIKNHGLQDVHKCLAEKDMLDTWKSGKNSSRIDFIFTSEHILDSIISHEILDIEDFKTDHKALMIKFRIKENTNTSKKKLFTKIKKELNFIKLGAEDWDDIAGKVEEQLKTIEEGKINRKEIWDFLVKFYEKERKEKIQEIKNTKKEAMIKDDPNDMTDTEKIKDLIDKYENLEKINTLEYEIIKLVDKVIRTKWNLRKDKDYIYNAKEFRKTLIIENWETTDTEINIKKREIYLEEDIGKMLNRILERKKEKIDMSGLIIRENRKITIEKNQEKIKAKVHNHFKEWTSERKIDLDEIEYNHEWREIYTPKEDIDEEIYKNLMIPITRDGLD
ncbi:hypothetical protein RhiirA5_369839 [Rhizophagus irregularis]|uniref:Endonuclease/exonuclease/phosphatase domain-containing protein n=1 Tax=Rhizophagus irregularis TaxID=588596 RepID=A0A2N0QBM2_9GLOM|nr:hypothetical protein RhiirA5_369839 [Rhizophagus irregularis]